MTKLFRDPRQAINFLDSCGFDPKYLPEQGASHEIQKLGDQGVVVLTITYSNQYEIAHPNTPGAVKRAAANMIYTIETDLTHEETARKNKIQAILTGNGNTEKHIADAEHIFEAGKYVGYFITTDERILSKKQDIESICSVSIVKPSQWRSIFDAYVTGNI